MDDLVIPEVIARLRNRIRGNIDSDPAHEPLIKDIMQLLLALSDGDGTDDWHAIRRQLFADLLAVEKSLPLWMAVYGQCDLPSRLAEMTRLLICSRAAVSDANRLLDEYAAGISVSPRWPLSEILDAAQLLLHIAVLAVSNGEIGYGDIKSDYSENGNDDVSVDDWPCVYRVSIAWSGGGAWEPGSSSKLRLQFWHWWLDEAIPTAYCQPK